MSALRRLRIDRHLSIAQLAEQSGVSDDQIRNIETGRAKNPRTSTLVDLARVLEVRPSELDPVLAAAEAANEGEAA